MRGPPSVREHNARPGHSAPGTGSLGGPLIHGIKKLMVMAVFLVRGAAAGADARYEVTPDDPRPTTRDTAKGGSGPTADSLKESQLAVGRGAFTSRGSTHPWTHGSRPESNAGPARVSVENLVQSRRCA